MVTEKILELEQEYRDVNTAIHDFNNKLRALQVRLYQIEGAIIALKELKDGD